jgi:hypothetical protein
MLWIEGVDFDNTLLDTNDISTMRGASLTLLQAPTFAVKFLVGELGDHAVKPVFTGASLGAVKLIGEETDITNAVEALKAELCQSGEDHDKIDGKPGNDVIERLEDVKGSPYAHMRFVLGLAKIDDKPGGDIKEREGQALELAKARAQSSRYTQSGPRRELKVDPGVPTKPCAKSPMRAAEVLIPAPGSAQLPVARATAARWKFGRRARQGFYRQFLGSGRAREDTDLWFVDSLDEMVAPSPELDEPEAPDARSTVAFSPGHVLQNKIALFYADGNKFTAIRQRIVYRLGVVNGLREFSTQLLDLQKKKLLTPIVEAMYGCARGPGFDRFALKDPREKYPVKLRLETLLWGGDEVMWAMPSWLGWWFARTFFEATKDWQIEGERLTFGAGLLFCNYKTPIRQARALVQSLGDMAKSANDKDNLKNRLEVEVVESIDPPQERLGELRSRLTGIDANSTNFAIEGEELGPLIQRIWALKDENGSRHLPRSQIYRVLGLLADEGIRPATGGKRAHEAFKTYMDRAGTDRGDKFELRDLNLSGGLAGVPEFALNLYRLAQFWDYVDAFSAAGANPGAGS